ncbi:MAG: hypothetical protein Q9211_006087 [Gyalolechia sp. 1 TL-2023]
MTIVPPSRRFRDLRRDQPDLSDSVLLNSNNRDQFTSEPDVAVVGAGIIGLCYAIHLKNLSPHLKISVFERSPAPTEKIGESTLSPFSKLTSGDMCHVDYFLRLFGLKDGLQFYRIDEHDREIPSSDIGGLDISYQLDRRMSELFFTLWAQKIGINVYHGVECGFELPNGAGQPVTDFSSHSISGDINPPKITLKDPMRPIATTTQSIDAKLVVDASGFSRKLTSKFGNKEKLGPWNCDAYWAYFKQKDGGFENVDKRLNKWDYPATKHMCFPEGWGWFIGLISWHHAPMANLMDLLEFMVENASGQVPADEIPSTQDLSAVFECPFEFITSIGWAVRNDFRTFPENLDEYGAGEGERKFNFIKRKYPALERLMDGSYELLPKYYGAQTYFVRKTLAYRSPVVAGDGWLAIGNSGGFTNPLISPGINAGIGGAVIAAHLTESIFAARPNEKKAVMQRCARLHQVHLHDFRIPKLHLMNRYWYNSFRDHRLFEGLTACYWTLAIDEVDGHYEDAAYSMDDTKWNVGSGGDEFNEFAEKVLGILEPADELIPAEGDVEKVVALSAEVLERRHKLYPANTWGRYLREYNDRLQKAPGKSERDPGGKVSGTRCSGCNYWVHNRASCCPICGSTSAVFQPNPVDETKSIVEKDLSSSDWFRTVTASLEDMRRYINPQAVC